MKRKTTQLMILAAALAAGGGASAQGPASAASEALGGAYVAKADEAGALFVNPAGLGQLQRGEVSFIYGKPLTGVPDVSIQQGAASVALPAGRSFTIAGGAQYADNAGLSREYEGAAGGALRLRDGLWAGAAVTYLRRDFNLDGISGASVDPAFAHGTSKGAPGVDAGLLMQASERIYLGASAQNINRPDLGLTTTDKVPMEWRAGAAFRGDRLSLLGELRGADGGSTLSRWGAGVEWRVASPLFLRAGADDQQFSAGLGLSFRDFRLDYAFSFLGAAAAAGVGTHRMSFNYRFGGPRDEQPQPARVSKPVRRTTAARPAPVRRASPTYVGSSTSTGDVRAYPVRGSTAPSRRMKPLQ